MGSLKHPPARETYFRDCPWGCGRTHAVNKAFVDMFYEDSQTRLEKDPAKRSDMKRWNLECEKCEKPYTFGMEILKVDSVTLNVTQFEFFLDKLPWPHASEDLPPEWVV